MTQKLSRSAISVHEALTKLKLPCKIIELPSSTRTATDAALSIGCDIAQIVKALIFKTTKTDKPALVLASGANQVDVGQLEIYAGESITKADAKYVKQVTGYAMGGIPPFGHKSFIGLVYLDQDLLGFQEVWAAAGTPNSVFCIKVQDLLNMTNATVRKLRSSHEIRQ